MIVSGYEPPVPAAAVPVMVAAPGVAEKAKPVGSAPASDTVGVGAPVAAMLIVPLVPTTKA